MCVRSYVRCECASVSVFFVYAVRVSHSRLRAEESVIISHHTIISHQPELPRRRERAVGVFRLSCAMRAAGREDQCVEAHTEHRDAAWCVCVSIFQQISDVYALLITTQQRSV